MEKKQGKWEARIGQLQGKKYIYLGLFDTEEEAARAYDVEAIKWERKGCLGHIQIIYFFSRNQTKGNACCHKFWHFYSKFISFFETPKKAWNRIHLQYPELLKEETDKEEQIKLTSHSEGTSQQLQQSWPDPDDSNPSRFETISVEQHVEKMPGEESISREITESKLTWNELVLFSLKIITWHFCYLSYLGDDNWFHYEEETFVDHEKIAPEILPATSETRMQDPALRRLIRKQKLMELAEKKKTEKEKRP